MKTRLLRRLVNVSYQFLYKESNTWLATLDHLHSNIVESDSLSFTFVVTTTYCLGMQLKSIAQ